MNGHGKQRAMGAISVLTAFAAVFCISRMIPYGLSGNAGKVKLWFALMMAALIIGLVSGMAYYYYKAKDDVVLPRIKTEVETLGKVGKSTQKK